MAILAPVKDFLEKNAAQLAGGRDFLSNVAHVINKDLAGSIPESADDSTADHSRLEEITKTGFSFGTFGWFGCGGRPGMPPSHYDGGDGGGHTQLDASVRNRVPPDAHTRDLLSPPDLSEDGSNQDVADAGGKICEIDFRFNGNVKECRLDPVGCLIWSLCLAVVRCDADFDFDECLATLAGPVGSQIWDNFGLEESKIKIPEWLENCVELEGLSIADATRLAVETGLFSVNEPNLEACLAVFEETCADAENPSIMGGYYYNAENLISEDTPCGYVLSVE